MSVGNRIRELRKNYLKLNQTDFAAPLGLNQSTIGGYENDFRSVSDATILAICRQYGVREEWLRNGTGEVFASVPASAVSDIAREYDLDGMDQALISEYLKLDPPSRSVLKGYIRNVFLAGDDQAAIDREVEAYRRELEAEKRETGGSSVSATTDAKEA